MENSKSFYNYISGIKTIVAGQLIRLGDQRSEIEVSYEHDPINKNAIVTHIENSSGQKYILIDTSGYLLAYASSLVLYRRCNEEQKELLHRGQFYEEIKSIEYGLTWLKSNLSPQDKIVGSIEKALKKLKNAWIERSDLVSIIDQIDRRIYESQVAFNGRQFARQSGTVH